MATILTQSTIYIGKNLFGIASKITAPEIDFENVEIKTPLGSYNLNTGIKPMTSSVTITGFDKDVFDTIANPYGEINMTIYGNLSVYKGQELAAEKQVKLVLVASSQKFPLLGELEQQNNIEYNIDFNCSAARLTIDDVDKYHIDIANNIFKVKGKDILKQLRKNLALS